MSRARWSRRARAEICSAVSRGRRDSRSSERRRTQSLALPEWPPRRRPCRLHPVLQACTLPLLDQTAVQSNSLAFRPKQAASLRPVLYKPLQLPPSADMASHQALKTHPSPQARQKINEIGHRPASFHFHSYSHDPAHLPHPETQARERDAGIIDQRGPVGPATEPDKVWRETCRPRRAVVGLSCRSLVCNQHSQL